MSLTNKDKAKIYHAAVSEYDIATIKAMVHENYIQHNPLIPTGRSAFLDLIPLLKKHKTKIENQRIFQDGDYVIMHHLWKNAAPFGADQKVAFHIIRFDQKGLIAEHWSVMNDYVSSNSSSSPIEGPREITNLEETANNKIKAAELFESIHPQAKRHKIFGSGNFVLSVGEGVHNHKPIAFYDLLRLEKGAITNHWNIYQEIPTTGLANNNTMFGFN